MHICDDPKIQLINGNPVEPAYDVSASAICTSARSQLRVSAIFSSADWSASTVTWSRNSVVPPFTVCLPSFHRRSHETRGKVHST